MKFNNTLLFTLAMLACVAIVPEHSAWAKSSLCLTCPVPGINSKATEALGPVQNGGPCHTRQGANGFPIPDSKCTPGAFNPTVLAQQFGAAKFRTDCVRDCLTDSGQKRKQYQSYGLKQNSTCELDHLVPLEMGGADSLDNIWPQCGKAPDGRNYKDIKDRVEEYLSIKVLQGMDLGIARNGIASDWTQFIGDATKFCGSQSCSIQDYRK